MFQLAKNSLREEAKRLAEFDPNLYFAAVYDCFDENNTVYMVMELIRGITLRQYLKTQNSLTEEDIRIIGLIDYGAVSSFQEKRNKTVMVRQRFQTADQFEHALIRDGESVEKIKCIIVKEAIALAVGFIILLLFK